MLKDNLLNSRLKELIDLFEITYSDNLKYLTEEDVDIIVRKRCNAVAAYFYDYINSKGDNKLNLIVIFDGWNEFLQNISMNGIHVGKIDNSDFDISLYALNINDFNLDSDYLESYSNTNIIFDSIEMFSNLDEQCFKIKR